MLNWIRDKLFKRQSVSRTSTREPEEIESYYSGSLTRSTMHDDQTSSLDEKITLHVIYMGDIWPVNVTRQQVLSDLINMSMTHFFDPKESHKSASKYRFISVASNKVLRTHCTVGEEGLRNKDEILLAAAITTGATNPIKLSLQDIKGPSKEDVLAATAHLPIHNPITVIPMVDCPENFQAEIRKVLYSLVEASAKILAQSPDAKVVFDGIAARINAKNKKEIDKSAIKYLKDLGFTEAQARYALRLKRNRQIEAMEWLLENSDRVKENAEPEEASTSTSDNQSTVTETNDPLYTINKLLTDIQDFHYRHFEPSQTALENLLAMGFSRDDVVEALRATSNNQVAACEWLCGERDPNLTHPEAGLDVHGRLYKALINNPAIQLGMHNPKIMLAFLSILENPSSANLWMNDVDTRPVLGQVFKTYHSEKHIMMVNQQLELLKRQEKRS